MNLKTLITILVLGSSTVGIASTASAAPMHGQRTAKADVRDRRVEARPVVRDHREQARPIVRDHREPTRYERPRYERPRVEVREQRRPIIERPIVRERYYTQPVYQTTSYEAVTPFVGGQMFLSLGGAAGNGIELASNGGSTFVQQVAIKYMDGRTQLLDVGQSVDASNPSIDLATDGDAVQGVVIYGQGTGVSAFAI